MIFLARIAVTVFCSAVMYMYIIFNRNICTHVQWMEPLYLDTCVHGLLSEHLCTYRPLAHFRLTHVMMCSEMQVHLSLSLSTLL